MLGGGPARGRGRMAPAGSAGMLGGGPAGGRGRMALAAALAAVLALSAAVLGAVAASPVRADVVRDREAWVLNMLHVPQAWAVSQGRGVIVAVIDSGVNPDVSDLTGSVITGPDYTGVGTPPSNPGWGQHGTWMASLIAGHGHGGGGDGIIGMAPQSRVLSIRVITDRADPGYQRYMRQPQTRIQHELADAIRYAVAHGAGVISMSLGYSLQSRSVRSALQDAFNHNVVVVASSGNSGGTMAARGQGGHSGQAPYSFPADYLGVLGVGAVNSADQPAGFSSDNLSVQVAAPGVDVPAQGRDGQYWLVSGTSPACALTAGVAALIRSAYPRLSQALVREAITATAQHRPPGGYDDRVGFGTVDAAAALAAARRLSEVRPAASSGVSGAAFFGGGPAAVPAPPVTPRGPGRLVVLAVLAVCSLVVTLAAAARLLSGRRRLSSQR